MLYIYNEMKNIQFCMKSYSPFYFSLHIQKKEGREKVEQIITLCT